MVNDMMDAMKETPEGGEWNPTRAMAMRAAMIEPKITYGCTVRWHTFSGALHEVNVSGLPDLEAARDRAFEIANLHGWEPRRWWQLWRLRDTRIMEATPKRTGR